MGIAHLVAQRVELADVGADAVRVEPSVFPTARAAPLPDPARDAVAAVEAVLAVARLPGGDPRAVRVERAGVGRVERVGPGALDVRAGVERAAEQARGAGLVKQSTWRPSGRISTSETTSVRSSRMPASRPCVALSSACSRRRSVTSEIRVEMRMLPRSARRGRDRIQTQRSPSPGITSRHSTSCGAPRRSRARWST